MEKSKKEGISRRNLLTGGAALGATAMAAVLGEAVWSDQQEQNAKAEKEKEAEQSERTRRQEAQKQRLEYLQSEWSTKIIGIEKKHRVGPPGGTYPEFSVQFPNGEIHKFDDLGAIEIHPHGGHVSIPGEGNSELPVPEDPRLKGLPEADIYKQLPSIQVEFIEIIPFLDHSGDTPAWEIDTRRTSYVLQKEHDGSIKVAKGTVQEPRRHN